MNERLVYVVGPSGAGKDSLLRWLVQHAPAEQRLHLVRRTVTRPHPAPAGPSTASPALDEEEAVEEQAFADLLSSGAFAMHWQANGLSYGVRHAQLAPLASGAWVLLSGSRAHLAQAQTQFPGLRGVHVLASEAVLRERLLARGRESAEAVQARLARGLAHPAPPGALCIANDHSLDAAGELLRRSLFGSFDKGMAFEVAAQAVRPGVSPAAVVAVHRQARHVFSKEPVDAIDLVAGHGVRGDAHFGTTVKHRSRVARDPFAPNLRQVHLLHQELLDQLNAAGLRVAAGQMGENITTQGLNLLALPKGTRLRLGEQAVVELTGLRNPCAQIERFRPGLLAAVTPRGPDGQVQRLSGVMAVVLEGGSVQPGDALRVVHWPDEHRSLQPV
jgi:phosphonate metabolism protein PhnN/1,5-bisphosphokinase (PRPP-forming)